MDNMDEERERLFRNHRLEAVHGRPRYPEAIRDPPPAPREFEPGFPFVIEGPIDTRTGDWDSTQVVHNNVTWSIVWKTYCSSQQNQTHGAGITLVRLTDDKKAYSVVFSVDIQNVQMGTLVVQKCVTVFDSTHKSIHIRDVLTFADARCKYDGPCSDYTSSSSPVPNGQSQNSESINPPVIVVKITIYSVTQIPNFEYLGQKWPYASCWLSYGQTMQVTMRETVLMDMNPRFSQVKHDLGNKFLSPVEATAFYDFASVIFNRAFTGTDKYQLALRQGFKFGFSRNWELFDQNDSDLDFLSRTCIPLFNHLGEETNPPESEQFFTNTRRVTAFGKFKLLNGNPFRRFWALRPQDVKTQNCQFYVYLETTNSGETLLMAGGIFTCSNKEVATQFLAKVQVQYIIGNDVKLQFHAQRIIHPRQRTINIVMGVMDAEHLSILESDRSQFFVSVCKSDTNVYHIGNYPHPSLAERTRKRESEDRRLARKARRDCGEKDVEPDSEDEPEPPKELVMPGIIDAWLISSDKKRIGVSRAYLSNYSEYFRTKLNDNSFGDCGGDSAQVEEEVEIIWATLEIIYHRSLLISPDNYHRIASLGDLWLAPIVKRYVEMALLQSTLISSEEKREAASLYHFDVIKYILRHPEYAKDYDVVFPDGVNRVTADTLDDEIDGGPGRRPRRDPAEPLLRPPPNVHAPPPQHAPLVAAQDGDPQAALPRQRLPILGNLLEPIFQGRVRLPFGHDELFADRPGFPDHFDGQRRRENQRLQRNADQERNRRGHHRPLPMGGNREFEQEGEEIQFLGMLNPEEARRAREARREREIEEERERDRVRNAWLAARQAANQDEQNDDEAERNERLHRLFAEDRRLQAGWERLENERENREQRRVPRRRRPNFQVRGNVEGEGRDHRRGGNMNNWVRVEGNRPINRERREGEPIVEFPPDDDDHPHAREQPAERRLPEPRRNPEPRQRRRHPRR